MNGPSLDREDVIRRISDYHKEASRPFNRGKSWEHCFGFFRDRERIRDAGEEGRDSAALHLAFFLASWGMYRGSSFLLQRDYQVHTGPVDVILKPDYDSLLSIDYSSQDSAGAVRRVFGLVDELGSAYRTHVSPNEPSDTLITKILMSTVGCTPAFDTYVVTGLRRRNVRYSVFNEDSLERIWAVYRDNASIFAAAQQRLGESGHLYTPMKLVDMYFWELGRPVKSGSSASQLEIHK
jgi:hypothetical protein